MPLLYVWPLPKKRPDATNTVQFIEVYKNFIISKPFQPLSALAYSLLDTSHFKFADTFRSGSSVPLAGRNCLALIAGVFGALCSDASRPIAFVELFLLLVCLCYNGCMGKQYLEIFYGAGVLSYFSRYRYLLHILAAMLCSVQSSVACSSDDTSDELLRLMNLTSKAPSSITNENSMRHSELDFTALSIGSSSGLKWRYDQIMENLLEPNAQHLNRIFDFSRFMVDGKIYLPAVRIAKDDISFEDDKQTLVRVSYTISEEAILRSSAPNFRDYLYRDFPTPEDPHWKLLPENNEERARWKSKVSEGFSKGVDQANDIYRDRLAEMRSDYLDRQNFLNLVSKNMVSQPSILVRENGITFNGRTMNVGEIVYQMSGDAEYLNETNWGSAWEK